jgi:predicted amidophosphoribosyltransferase
MAKSVKRPCKICKADLNTWGPDRRGVCPACAEGMRSALVMCAGKCGKKYTLRTMETVVLYFDPGKRGGKKIRLHYCTRCAVLARSRARMASESQEETIRKAESRIARGAVVEERQKGGLSRW